MVKRADRKRKRKIPITKSRISKRLKSMVWQDRIGDSIGKIQCPCCGDNIICQSNFHTGHIKAASKGGTLAIDNLVPICSQCNLSMLSQNMKTFMYQQFKRDLVEVMEKYKNYGDILTKLIDNTSPTELDHLNKNIHIALALLLK